MRSEASVLLKKLAGPSAELREDQWAAISALVAERRRVLCVQRTGWGKSAVYFIATALLRARGAGPTVIVSPLIALMRNQVDAAARAGIAARAINSANLEEWDQITGEIAAGTVDVLLVSPERLNNPDFRDNVLPKLAASTGLLVVDEAHCVSDWGHDFRPDYRRLATLLADLAPGTPVLATTATANARVTADVAEQLGDALVLRGSLDRESLRLGSLTLPSAPHRLAWLGEHLGAFTGSGIIYTLTVAAAHETAAYLRGCGYEVAAYTGQTENADRLAAEEDLLNNRIKALVATSALGMGFDKPDLGFVVHLGAPSSPIAYYQQVGRAGRAVDKADVLLLPGTEDQAIWRYFASLAFPPEAQVRGVLSVLGAAGRPMSTAAIEPQVELRRGRLELMLKVLDVDGAVRRVRGGWESTGAPWRHDSERYDRIDAARAAEQDAMREYAALTTCRLEFLRRTLDDPGAVPCGRCDTCAGTWYPAEVSDDALASARAHLGRTGVEIAPRKLWPTGLSAVGVSLTGKIPPAEQTLPGRAIGRLSDLGWGDKLRRLLAAPDAPLPDDIFAGVVATLTEWAKGDERWPARPVGVVVLGSQSTPVLLESLGARIAEVGRMPLLGTVQPAHAADAASRTNSAQRVRALHTAFTVPSELAARLGTLDGPVLLVDDLVDTGWTMAIAGRLLLRAGAPAVLPFALAVSA
ncbi:DEAD/DEAH box helicase [Dactylosporangium maewongense]|uniref:DNA 3'-5' helicase n=1 Tax=Dactylosporangium maewongense TaxID=634393 RepID=A0ABN2A3D0_9ACTN